jgi:polyhydroxyalkanoate synthesis regulator phasin
MLKPKHMRSLDWAIADAGRADLAELMRRIRAARKAEFEGHIRQLIRQIEFDRRLRQARVDEIRSEVREFKDEWRKQVQRFQRAKTEQI